MSRGVISIIIERTKKREQCNLVTFHGHIIKDAGYSEAPVARFRSKLLFARFDSREMSKLSPSFPKDFEIC